GSGGEPDRTEPGQGVVEVFGPWPVEGEVQGAFAGRGGEAAGHDEVAAAQGVCGDEGFAEADAAGPAGHVVGDDVECEPGGVRTEAPGRHVVQADTVFQFSDRVFYHGVAAMVGLQEQHVAGTVGDKAVVGVVGV